MNKMAPPFLKTFSFDIEAFPL